MVDLDHTTGFEWDEGNYRKNYDKHDVSQEEAEQVFFGEPLLTFKDPGHSISERRFHALGVTRAGRGLHVTFTLRGTKIRVISARNMSRKEQRMYSIR